VTKKSPTVVGISLAKENTAIMYDRELGAYQLSLDELRQTLKFDLFGDSFQRSLSGAFEEIKAKRPDVLEKANPTNFIDEIKRIFAEIGAHRFE